MTPLWTEKERPVPPEALFRLLVIRGVHAVDDAKRFLRPRLDGLVPAEALTDLTRAAERLSQAIDRRERILVHGDYDVDGICSTAMLTRGLRALGADVEPFIPDRRKDGYDLGAAGVAKAQEIGARVVLTCDCGTTALAAARALREAGIDLIITDHHRLAESLPECFALVNPQRERDVESRDDQYLAAVGVAWKLLRTLTAMRGGDLEAVDDQLELVALATVADVASLKGDNRIFVAEGLRRMTTAPAAGKPDRRNRGLQWLIRSASLDDKRLTAGRLGFVVAPRLNALGRVRQAIEGVQLLLTDDDETASRLARLCNEANAQRQELDRSILEEAQRMLDAPARRDALAHVLAGEGWEPGVIGIVASRIAELTHRPTFMIAVHADGGARIGKGSGRSIPGFDLHAALSACGDLLDKYGGHRAAAGLTIQASRIEAFAERFEAHARAEFAVRPDLLEPELRPDLELPLHAADDALLAALRHLEPFGVGNAGPVLVSRGVRLRGPARTVGNDGLKLSFATESGPKEGVGWGLGARRAQIPADGAIDIVYRLELNEYRGASTLQANLLDFAPSDG